MLDAGELRAGVARLRAELSAAYDDGVVLVEDVVDTGLTLTYLLGELRRRSPRTLEVCALLDKPSRREVDVRAKWVGFEIPDAFVVGYGIDYAQRNRNLPHIGVVRFLD